MRFKRQLKKEESVLWTLTHHAHTWLTFRLFTETKRQRPGHTSKLTHSVNKLTNLIITVTPLLFQLVVLNGLK